MIQTHNQLQDNLEEVSNINFSINNYKEFVKDYIKDKERFAVCLIDIKNFKMYNHRFGYKYGDAILIFIYTELKKQVIDRGAVFRYGGDVLLLLFWDFIDNAEVENVIIDFLYRFNQPNEVISRKINIELNAGIAIYDEDSYKIETLLKYADIALYYSKHDPNESYKFFNSSMYEEIIMKEIVEMDIINALNKNEFILYYQPQINLCTGNIYGVEALIRWKHPLYGILPPLLFINIIEENGMINHVGQWVIKEACRQREKWHELGYRDICVSVNVSSKQLKDENFFHFVQNIIEETGIDPSFLYLEITEHSLCSPKNDIMSNLAKLRNLGLKIYLDDFGTYYSSLNQLCNLPIDGIKIDKSFVDDIISNDKKFIITRKIVELADELGIDVVVEGVEQKEQLDCLIEINCNKIQGYFFGKPMVSNEINELLKIYNLKKV